MAGHSAQGVVRVSRKPNTASETEIVRLITATNESTPIGNFTQLVKDLASAGIVISGNQVAIKGDKVTIYNKDGVALFAQDGKLYANLIDADKIEVKHLWAKSEDGTTKVGYFGNYEIDACKVDDTTYAPLFVGADTAAKSPFYVTNEGHMVSTSATLGCFSLDKMSFRYISGYEDEEPVFALYNNYMLFREYSRTLNPDTHTWKSERKRTVWLGEYRTSIIE